MTDSQIRRMTADEFLHLPDDGKHYELIEGELIEIETIKERSMTDTQTRLVTADELLHWPDDGKRYELIEGELIEMSPTSAIHGIIALELAALIRNHVRANKLGRVFAAETGFRLFPDQNTVLGPDVAFISVERAQPLTEGFTVLAPDLAVEVVSPNNSADEINRKIGLYFQAGSRQVWIVYPKTRTVHVYSSATKVVILTSQDTLDGADVLPGFQLPLADLFSVLDN